MTDTCSRFDDVMLRRLGPAHLRLGTEHLWVDILEHPGGNVRIGSFPDIMKALSRFDLDAPFVVVPPRFVTEDGDNWTGEEFVGWAGILRREPPRLYTGTAADLARFRQRLLLTLPWWFDADCINILCKDWMDRHFHWLAAEERSTLPNGVTVAIEAGRVRLLERGRVCLDVAAAPEAVEPPGAVAAPASRAEVEGLRVTCLGSGNGMGGRTASFVAAWANRTALVDPTARPRAAMERAGVPWGALTDIVITHNHEDHMLGTTAALEVLRREGRRVTLITSQSVLDTLNQQMVGLWDDVRLLVDWTRLEPDAEIRHWGATIRARRNHHILPSDTLGLLIEHQGRRLGFSGDTKYDRRINEILGRPELEAGWFDACDAVLHEGYFGPPGYVHTHVAELEHLATRLPGRTLLYHCPDPGHTSVRGVVDGTTYDVVRRDVRRRPTGGS